MFQTVNSEMLRLARLLLNVKVNKVITRKLFIYLDKPVAVTLNFTTGQ